MVSDHGRISQSKSLVEHISRGTCKKNGYFSVVRADESYLVHRVVAATFLGPPPAPDMQVHHKDCDRANNHVQNLEYVTASENARYAWQGAAREARKAKTGRAVHALSIAGDTSQRRRHHFESMAAAILHSGVYREKMLRICMSLDSSLSWLFQFAAEDQLPGEQWRPVVLDGARRPFRV